MRPVEGTDLLLVMCVVWAGSARGEGENGLWRGVWGEGERERERERDEKFEAQERKRMGKKRDHFSVVNLSWNLME